MGLPIGVGMVAGEVAKGLGQEMFNQFQHSRNMQYYRMQRFDALQDWQREAAYNSPAAQMQRLKAAGLSPHLQGSGAVTTGLASQTRASSTGNSPASYQVNNATTALSIKQGLEQIRAMQLQNEKTAAETQGVQQDNKSKALQYNVDSETMLQTKYAQLEQMRANVALSRTSISEKRQQITNMRETLESIIIDNEMKRTQQVYQNDLLRGNVKLQDAQIANIKTNTQRLLGEIRSIDIRNYQDVKMFDYKINQILQDIRGARTRNDYQDMINYHAPETLRGQRDKTLYESQLTKEQLDYLQTLSPQVRYLMDKYGNVGGAILGKMLKK